MKLPNTDSLMDNNTPDVDKVIINTDHIGPFRPMYYDYDDAKVLDKYIKSVERTVRGSVEYRRYIRYLKEEIDLTRCIFFDKIDVDDIKGIKIEMHHYPYTLYDISYIVTSDLTEEFKYQVPVLRVAEQVMKLHFENLVGIVPLTVTAHEAAHTGSVFISLEHVFGDIFTFSKKYSQHINRDMLDKLDILATLSESPELDPRTQNNILKKKFQYILDEDTSFALPLITNAEIDSEMNIS